ncbi:MAG: glycosyltransferase family 2 protein [Gemmatimonadota bacterium]|nr:glycosyltransferase family 2 protein [Gemmatimonadota bacterium]
MLTVPPAPSRAAAADRGVRRVEPQSRATISGFTVVRNAVIMGYPIVESIRSILPIVDEFIVAVGASDDGTRALIENIGDAKIRIVDTVWDRGRNRGGHILAEKTNEALALCQGTWCFYLQADEVVHENDLPAIRAACDTFAADDGVQGLLFAYVHFYGSFQVVARARNWYRNEVRIVRNRIGARSVGDAQSFCIRDDKPRVAQLQAKIMHYGWAKPPISMSRKQTQFAYWYTGGVIEQVNPAFRFRQLYGLRTFTGSHPAIMREQVAAQNWHFSPRLTPSDWNAKDWKNLLSDGLEFLTRRRWGERKKYRIVR